MSTFWDLFKSPPTWILAIVLTIIVSHLIRTGLKLPNNRLIPILEFFVVVTLGILTAHSFLAPTVFDKSEQANQSLYLLLALVGFTLASIILYLVDNRHPAD
jgi:hypothetical protein